MFDALNCFTLQTDGTLVQAVTTDAASTNIIDLDVAGISAVNPSIGPYLILKVGDTAFADTVSIEVRLQTDSDSGFSTTLKHIGIWRFVLAQMTAGALLINQMLPIADFQRYVRLHFNVFTTAADGSFFGCLADGPETPQTDLTLEEAGS